MLTNHPLRPSDEEGEPVSSVTSAPDHAPQVAWKNAGRLVGRRRKKDSWGADSTAIGRQLAELNTLQVLNPDLDPLMPVRNHDGFQIERNT